MFICTLLYEKQRIMRYPNRNHVIQIDKWSNQNTEQSKRSIYIFVKYRQINAKATASEKEWNEKWEGERAIYRDRDRLFFNQIHSIFINQLNDTNIYIYEIKFERAHVCECVCICVRMYVRGEREASRGEPHGAEIK